MANTYVLQVGEHVLAHAVFVKLGLYGRDHFVDDGAVDVRLEEARRGVVTIGALGAYTTTKNSLPQFCSTCFLLCDQYSKRDVYSLQSSDRFKRRER